MPRVFLFSTLLLVGSASQAGENDLPRSTPEAQGLSSSAIIAFVKEADRSTDTMHSVMILRHGCVVAEGWWSPYDSVTRHSLYSLSKSFTSTAVGLAIAEGKLSLDDEVLKAFPDDAPAEPSDNLKSMRVRDLMRMSTGHQSEASLRGERSWTQSFLAQPVPFKPGTHFLYNTPATYMLSAMLQKATGQTLLDYLKPRLFDPLGIEGATWEKSPQGISTGGYGLSIRTEDIARFGQLLLRKGQWQGKQVVPPAWVEQATSRQTSNGSNPKSDWDQGYGYQFWRSRNNAYRGDGAFGQYCIVLPEQDAVIAITSGTKDMQGVLNLVWDKLLPAMKAEPLSPDNAGQTALLELLKKLTLPLPSHSGAPAPTAGKVFTFPKNDRDIESVSIRTDGEQDVMIARVDGSETRVEFSRGSWRKRTLAWGGFPEQPAATSGGWQGDTFIAKISFVETPFLLTLRFRFSGDQVTLSSQSNVGFGPTSQGDLVGKAE